VQNVTILASFNNIQDSGVKQEKAGSFKTLPFHKDSLYKGDGKGCYGYLLVF